MDVCTVSEEVISTYLLIIKSGKKSKIFRRHLQLRNVSFSSGNKQTSQSPAAN